MRLFFAAALTAVLSGCASGPYVDPITNLRNTSIRQADLMAESVTAFLKAGGSRAEAIEKGKHSVAQTLKDPESARFRNVALKPRDGKFLICGEVNGKNSYGGYVGFKRFIAGIDSGYIEDVAGKYPAITDAANFGIDSACWAESLPLTDKPAAIRS